MPEPSQLVYTCNVCGTDTDGKYCPTCGQKSTGKRLTLRSVIEDFLSNMFSLEKSGFATMVALLKDPATVVRRYWDGFRGHYQPPSKLLVYATIVIGLHLYYNENLIFGLQYTDNPKVVFFFVFLALLTLSSYLTYYRKGLTLLEHSISTIYLFCCWSILLVILYEIASFFMYISVSISITFTLSLLLFIFYNTAKVFQRGKGIIRQLILGTLQLILFVLILFILVGLGVYLGNITVSI